MQTLFRTLIAAFSCMFYFSGFDEKEVNGKPTKSFTRGRRAVYFGRRRKKKGASESFARTVKCRECSEAGRTISSVIKVMRYLVRAAEYGAAASIMEKKRGGGGK